MPNDQDLKDLVLSVDVMGVAGESQDAIEHDVFKQRVDSLTGKNITDAKPEKQLVNSTPKKAADDKNGKKPGNEHKKEKVTNPSGQYFLSHSF